MKIRPTDPSSLPAEPDGVSGKKQIDFTGLEETASEPAAIEKKKTDFSELQGLKGPQELGVRFAELTVRDYASSVGAGDLGNVQKFLQEQLEADPFLQGKLERISSLLAKK